MSRHKGVTAALAAKELVVKNELKLQAENPA